MKGGERVVIAMKGGVTRANEFGRRPLDNIDAYIVETLSDLDAFAMDIDNVIDMDAMI